MAKNGFRPQPSSLTPDQIPGSLVNRFVRDPASDIPGAPPMFGEMAIPHVFTVTGRYGLVASAYSNHHDEALYHSQANAKIMRNEPAIMECLEARMRCTALLNWHISPVTNDEVKSSNPLRQMFADKLKKNLKPVGNKWDAEELSKKVTEIIKHTPNFMKLRYDLMEALWFGRYAVALQFGARRISGNWRTYIRRWEPRHGDKLMFRYDDGTRMFDADQVGIRVGPGYDADKNWKDFAGNSRTKIEPTQHGLVYWLDGLERKGLVLHKHIIEDGDFNEPLKAGSIHGVGIRSRIYWTWWAYQEILKLLLEYSERSALGLEVWKYPAHSPEAKARAEKAASERGAPGRSVVLVPVPEGEMADRYGIEFMEPGLGGIGELKDMLDKFFGHKIKRYISGQTLSSEAEGTGMGSGVADAHMATLHDIIRFDAIGLEETLTEELVRFIQLTNFPGSDDIYLRFNINTESDESARKLEAYQSAWNMGVKLKAEDLYDVIGSSKPTDDDEILQNPAFKVPPAPVPMVPPLAPVMAGPMSQNPLSQGSDQATEEPAPEDPPVMFAAEPESEVDRMAEDLERHAYAMVTLRNLDQASVEKPSRAQADAGNFRKAHIRLHGLEIAIENPKGTRRRPEWPPLAAHYGYIKRTTGRDGDAVDCYIGSQPWSDLVVVVDQETPGGRFDEHKVILGTTNVDQAKRLYLANYTPGWRCGPLTTMTVDQLKAWIEKGDTKSRIADQVKADRLFR